MKRFVLALLGLLPLVLAGCEIPGVTHTREVSCHLFFKGVELSPDGQLLAYCIETVHLREAIGLAAYPDGGIPKIEHSTYEVYTWGLATRQPPKLIGRWRRRESDRYTLWFFDGRNVALAMDDGHTRRFERIDTVTGKRRRVARADESIVARERERLHPSGSAWDESRRRHVEEDSGEFLLWDPAKRECESLFELPQTLEHDSITYYSGWLQGREPRRRAYSIHQAWDCTSRSEDDSVYVTLQTFVRQPGKAVRAYRFWYSLSVPAKLDEHTSGYRDSLLVVVDRWLGPRGAVVTQSFPTKDLARIYAPQGRLFHESGLVGAAIEVRFAPVPLPEDNGAGFEGIYGGDFADAAVKFSIH